MSHSSVSQSGWRSQAGYIWSVLGSAVGFANILSFSAQAYKNGGGAFLIPYFIALFILGIPLLILEGVIGQRTKAPLVTAYGSVWGKPGKLLGWLAVIACLTIGGFYIVLTGYSLGYTYFAATGAIPEESRNFFLHTFLQLTPSLKEWGGISWLILVPTLGAIALTYFIMVRNVRDGIEKICSIFMPMLIAIMILFAIIASCLPGGLDGWVYFLKPNFSKLFDAALWRDVFGQLFFSLSLGLGIVVGYSRHTGTQTNIGRALLYVALGDFAVSFIAGIAIFATLAHISLIKGIPFEALLTTASTFEIGFVVFPNILHCFGALSQLVGVIFFFCVFIAGITGVFSIIESVAGNVEVEFRTTRKKAVTLVLLATTLLALVFSMGNASHLIDALAPMVLGINMLIGGLGLIFAFQFGSLEIARDPVWLGRWNHNRFFLRTLAPSILALIFIGTLAQEFQGVDLAKEVRWIWFALACGFASVLVRASKQTLSRRVEV